MPESGKPVYLVNACSDPVVVRIDGRACFQNSAGLKDFVTEMVRQGKRRFVVDFQHCASMDSTFLGVVAGAALELRKAGGTLIAARLGQRNLELMRNLGLHRLLIVDSGDHPMEFAPCDQALNHPAQGEIESARLVLEAHENLVTADEANRSKFQDVLVFLRDRVAQKQL